MLRSIARAVVPAEAWARLRRAWHAARRSAVDHLFAFGPDEFLGQLRALGIRAGDVIMVHSSYRGFEGFRGEPVDILATLREAVGEQGTVLMPTMPFDGSAIDYARAGRVFDRRRTPSKMGLLTEVFRRSKDTMRSMHPTHPVAAWGQLAGSLLSDHHLAETPCGPGTPWMRLTEVNAKLLFLGVDLGVNTLFHGIDVLLEQQMPVSPLTAERFVIRTRLDSGEEYPCETRLFDSEVGSYRRPQRPVPLLKSRGQWRQARVGLLRGICVEASAVVTACRDMAQEGQFIYDFEEMFRQRAQHQQ